MEPPTPTFGQEFASKRLKKKNNFSGACKSIEKIKPKGKKSCINLNELNNGLQKKKPKSKKSESHHKRRHQSQKFRIKDYKKISEVDDSKSRYSKSINKNNKKILIINNILDFIQKHKFKLRNDFDRKHSEQFLLSKESAFEKPFLLFEEIVEEKNMKFVFTLKND